MRNFVTKTAFLDGATQHLFKIKPESLEQLRHFTLNVHDVSALIAAAVLSGASKALHWFRPLSDSSGR
jgi:hypothetical protein